MVYLDSSALVKRYFREEGSAVVSGWLSEPVVATSGLSRVEITSALCRRQREGDLSLEDRDLLLLVLEDDCQTWTLVEVLPPVLTDAMALLQSHPLRAADSIQLASALYLREALGTEIRFGGFDLRLNQAALAEGLILLD